MREFTSEEQIFKAHFSEYCVQDLLSNSDEYARQRAMDWLKEE